MCNVVAGPAGSTGQPTVVMLVRERAPPHPRRFAVALSTSILFGAVASTRIAATSFVLSPAFLAPSSASSSSASSSLASSIASPWSTAALSAAALHTADGTGAREGAATGAAAPCYARPPWRSVGGSTRLCDSFAAAAPATTAATATAAAPLAMSATRTDGGMGGGGGGGGGGSGLTLAEAPAGKLGRGGSSSSSTSTTSVAAATVAVSSGLRSRSKVAPRVHGLDITTFTTTANTVYTTAGPSTTVTNSGPENAEQNACPPPPPLPAAAVVLAVAAASFVAVAACATTPSETKGRKAVAGAGVDALPGTWLVTGLPKSMNVVRRRMLTKDDWLHVHAASSMEYQVGGAMWLLNVMGLEHFGGVPQLRVDTPAPLFLLGAGLVSSLSSIPMANTRSWILNGVCSSVMQLWFAWYVSGAYPACLALADPWLAAVGFTILAISYVEAEQAIAKDSKAAELTRQTPELPNKRASGKVLVRKGDYAEGNAVNRYGALANLLLNAPHLFATLGGSGWVERLAETYPAAPALLFHTYVALATSTSIILLAPTLYTRRLIDAKTFAARQFISLAPIVTSAIDATVMGAAATNNPLELYLGFLH